MGEGTARQKIRVARRLRPRMDVADGSARHQSWDHRRTHREAARAVRAAQQASRADPETGSAAVRRPDNVHVRSYAPTEAVRQHGVGGPPKPKEQTVLRRQLSMPVVPSSCSAKLGPLEIRSRSGAEYFTVLAFDGSLQGGGATLQRRSATCARLHICLSSRIDTVHGQAPIEPPLT